MNDFISSNKYLSISAFSKLSSISRKNLIYYDSIGLLKPISVKDNGYRYYSYTQLDEVSIIIALRDLDVPLKEIKNYIENVSPDNLINLISSQKQKILEELNRLNQMNYIIEQRTNNVPVIPTLDCNKIFLEHCEEELLFLGPDLKYDINNFDDNFDYFLNYCNNKKLVYGYPLGVYANYNDIISDNISNYNFFYKVHSNIEFIEKTIKPSGLYVIAYHNSYLADNIKIFYPLDEFIKKNNLYACGNVYIENISDEIITKNPDKYFSKISVQVQKVL